MFGSRNFLFAKAAAAAGIAGQLWSWGNNNYGGLGLGDTANRSSPVQIGALVAWSVVGSSAANSSIAIKNNGTLWTWGQNTYGKLGLGNTTNYSSPKQVGALTNWAKPSMGFSGNSVATSACVKTDGTLWVWGENTDGQLGLNNTTSYSSPKQVGSDTNWALVSVGAGFMIAIKSTGSMWAWGRNLNYGQLGLGNTTFYSSPKQIGALTTWKQVSAGFGTSFAIKTDGTMWSWGANDSGNLGQNGNYGCSSPIQIGALTTWSSVSSGYNSSRAIKTDGTLWTWGNGGSGALGLGNTTSYSSPKQVGALTNWQLIRSIQNSALGIKTDGTLWSWGRNNTGQLAQDNTANRSSPVQIGALTTWYDVAGRSGGGGVLVTAIKTV